MISKVVGVVAVVPDVGLVMLTLGGVVSPVFGTVTLTTFDGAETDPERPSVTTR